MSRKKRKPPTRQERIQSHIEQHATALPFMILSGLVIAFIMNKVNKA